MAEDDDRRLERIERRVDDGFFVTKERYDADQRAQERTDLAQEQRFTALNDRLDEIRDSSVWMQRQIIIALFGIIAAAVIAVLGRV